MVYFVHVVVNSSGKLENCLEFLKFQVGFSHSLLVCVLAIFLLLVD